MTEQLLTTVPPPNRYAVVEGADVLFYPSTNDTQFTRGHGYAGKIVKVWSDTCVNVQVLLPADPDALTVMRSSVLVHKEGNPKPDGYYCTVVGF